METFLIRAVQLIFALSILVVIHELGHFLFARLCHTRVDKLYLFFNPWFSLFKYKSKRSGTEYGVGWLPLGGYCKIAGMVDESLDREQTTRPPQPDEFRARPAWQRLLMTTGGVLFNFITALLIYAMILFVWGDSYVPLRNMSAGMSYSDTFHDIGFEDGDILLTADDRPLERFGPDALRAVAAARAVTVRRGDDEVSILIPDDMMQRCIRDKQGFASVRLPLVIDGLADADSPAARAGLLPGDTVTAVNGLSTPSIDAVTAALRTYAAQPVTLTFRRPYPTLSAAEDTLVRQCTLTPDSAGRIGVFLVVDPARLYTPVTRSYSLFQSIPAGFALGVSTLKGYVSDMKYVFTKEGASSLGGFGAIGGLFPPVWNWRAFWQCCAFLSIILAFMNILPLPALDGGHAAFVLYEMVTRRKPKDKVIEYAQVVGMALLFALLLYANANDIFRLFS
jgi:regulator of sigma E protease